ncbi:MAG: NADH-quinone oxidoreductase subunit NuoG [Sphingomonadaceae bacterium]|uniref:NADH-quinone oxidoreductase subunit NuoG n=1 Tax=Thermaurantiacus sp. TaxID=2820283 RepID=UPI00298EDC1E|nr:NADH-quinone oxidoreductase subunit NuoG [Thermaurantiacus sp.]MCS6986676.1 NADH-quinone oxidoreductase subunit NuoG [Sphingomonadaceae bacterium]MDW8414061.1 NADH-quinone oxidoreductase subunit NuoG [Thermaurantiacus sp.]
MPRVTVDGIEVDVPQGATVMQACELAGREIPRFCYHERLSIAGNCRMCLVEVSPGPPKPQASCALPAVDGQVITTTSEKVRKARAGVLEFLLINHPLDCPICDQGGECDLQDQALAYGRGYSRFAEDKRAVAEKDMGPLVKTAMTRCIHCTRCVRFADEVAGVVELGAIGRGENMQITTYLERALTSELSGNVIDLCPVGALTAKPYAFAARPWELERTDGIDVMDAVGSNIRFHARSGAVIRITPRLNDEVNEEWLADHARFGVDGLKERRLDRPWVRIDGRLREASWPQAFAAIRRALSGVEGSDVAALVGDLAALEEIVALKDLLTGLGSARIECRLDGAEYAGHPALWRLGPTLAGLETADAILLVGANPRVDGPLVNTRIRKAVRYGGADVFRIGAPADLTVPVTELGDDLAALTRLPTAFLEARRPALLLGSRNATLPVLAAAGRLPLPRDDWNGFGVLHTAASRVGAMDVGCHMAGGLAALTRQPPRVLFLLGVDEVDLRPFTGAFLIYVGSHGDRGAAAANVVLPGAAWAEKPGTYVNLEGRVQRSLRAVFPPGDAREDWTILRALADVLGVRLPYDDLGALRARIAAEWPHLGRPGLSTLPWDPAAVPAAPPPSGPTRPGPAHLYALNPILRASPTMQACIASIVEGQGAVAEPVVA